MTQKSIQGGYRKAGGYIQVQILWRSYKWDALPLPLWIGLLLSRFDGILKMTDQDYKFRPTYTAEEILLLYN